MMKKIEELLRKKMLSNTSKRCVVFPTANGRRRTRRHLAEFLGEVNYNKGAEIGVRLGRFSRYLCSKNPNLKLYCIDPWDAYNTKYPLPKQERIYQRFLKDTKGLNIEVMRMTSMEGVTKFEDKFLDFVFIDGNHKFDFVMEDLLYWPKKVKSGGLIIVHDFYPFDDCGVWNAVKAYVHSHNLRCYATKEHEPTAYWVNP